MLWWSGAGADLARKDDRLARVAPVLDTVGRRPGAWREYLAAGSPEGTAALVRLHERTGRPLGGDGFVARLEKTLRRSPRKLRPGPKGRERGRRAG